ncbi:MAG: hypothetical protein AAF902_06885 [Chloroflexota bacterium]
MTPEQVLEKVQKDIPEDSSLEKALTTFINLFFSIEVKGCSKKNDGDMLLFQWDGFNGSQNTISINLTRQFMHYDENGDYEYMEHLQMDFNLIPDNDEFASGNFWCETDNPEEFMNQVVSSDIFQKASKFQTSSIQFNLFEV